MRTRPLVVLSLFAASACASSAPLSGAKVLDAGAAELVFGVEGGVVSSGCSGGDDCGSGISISPLVAGRFGLLTERLELGARLSPTTGQLDATVELHRGSFLALALQPAGVVELGHPERGYGRPRLSGQLLGLLELSVGDELSLIGGLGARGRFGATGLPGAEAVPLTAVGLQLRSGRVRLMPYATVTWLTDEDVTGLGPLLAGGLVVGLGL